MRSFNDFEQHTIPNDIFSQNGNFIYVLEFRKDHFPRLVIFEVLKSFECNFKTILSHLLYFFLNLLFEKYLVIQNDLFF